MIAPKDFRMNFAVRNPVFHPFRDQKIIDPPACVLFPCPETVRPPAINSFRFRIEIPKAVHPAGCEQFGHLTALLVGKTGVLPVGFRALQVDLLMGNIHIPADDHRFFLIQVPDISSKCVLPFYPVGEASQLLLGIRRVDIDQVKGFEFCCDNPPFPGMLFPPDIIGNASGSVLVNTAVPE